MIGGQDRERELHEDDVSSGRAKRLEHRQMCEQRRDTAIAAEREDRVTAANTVTAVMSVRRSRSA